MKAEKRLYRSVWISDVHLCTRDVQVDMLYNFLDSIKVDYLYLVGDIIDVWSLQKKWFWPNQYNEIIHKLLKRSRKGARVFYIPGNHDEMFRNFVGYRFGEVTIVSRIFHKTADGRRFLVMHGDEFDAAVRYKWLPRLGAWAYHYLTFINRMFNLVRRWMGKPYWSLSGAVKRKVKSAVRFVSKFEDVMVEQAREHKVDGVICGHIHQPVLRELDGGLLYCNTGDWIENCTALVEHHDGRLELLWWHDEVAQSNCLIESANDGDEQQGYGEVTAPTTSTEMVESEQDSAILTA